jgi:hypothetical protein
VRAKEVSMPRRQRRPLFASFPAAVTMASLAGCVAFGAQSQSCVEWVWFDSPADAMADAGLVVRATGPAASTGTAELFGTTANAHSVEVAEVLKGNDDATGQPLKVVSTPVTCTGGSVYPEGDPLDAPGLLILFLDWDPDAQAWRTITPDQGVVPAADDGTVPDSWPAG